MAIFTSKVPIYDVFCVNIIEVYKNKGVNECILETLFLCLDRTLKDGYS